MLFGCKFGDVLMHVDVNQQPSCTAVYTTQQITEEWQLGLHLKLSRIHDAFPPTTGPRSWLFFSPGVGGVPLEVSDCQASLIRYYLSTRSLWKIYSGAVRRSPCTCFECQWAKYTVLCAYVCTYLYLYILSRVHAVGRSVLVMYIGLKFCIHSVIRERDTFISMLP